MKRLGFAGALALGGCTVGPTYRAPETPVPAAFAEAPSPDAGVQPELAGWWRSYGDAELDRLIALGLDGSPDVKIAVARIAQARAAERQARAAFLPEVNASAQANYLRFSKNAGLSSLSSLFGGGGGGAGGSGGTSGGSTGGGTGTGGIAAPGDSITTYSVGFDASWEADVFGGTRRQVEGTRARTAAAVWSARDAQLSLIAEIADAYFTLRTLQDRERVAREEVDRQQRNLSIAQSTARSGLIAQGDFVRQRADLAGAEAAVGPIVAEGKATMHAIAVLTGHTPDALIGELAVARPMLPPPPAVPPGLPSDLLRRRPDVRAAERNLAAATADIGVAVADLYPRFSLTGVAQFISTALSNLLSPDSLQVTANGGATFPLLDFGRRSGVVDARRAGAEAAYQQYRQTVLGALRDVEDALVRLRTEGERRQSLARGLDDARRGVASVEARWRAGLTDYGDVLLARASLLQAEDGVVQSDGALRRDLLALYKALGGGWEGLPLDESGGRPGGAAYTAPRR